MDDQSAKVKPKMSRNLLRVLLAVLVVLAWPAPAAPLDPAATIASLIDPGKLVTLGQRGANPRVQKAVYWLATARRQGQDAPHLLDRAIAHASYTEAAGRLTKDALLRNLDIAEKLGCLNAAGLAEMRRGHAATIVSGPYQGDQLSVDHIIPRAVAPELDNVIANLELMPMRLNSKKANKVGERQCDLATKFFQAGLLEKGGLDSVIQSSARQRLRRYSQ